MSGRAPNIQSLSFLIPGSFSDDDPFVGLEGTLQLFELGEHLGYDGGWVRQQHLVRNLSAAPVFLAAATQRTKTLELGTGVIPIGYESPFRLAEDLSTLDILSRERLQVGLSAGVPPHAELLASLVYDGDWRDYDFSYGRIERLIDNLRSDYLGNEDTLINSPGGAQRPRLQPHNPRLLQRIWYGAASLNSVLWAAERGLHLALGNITIGEGMGTDDFVSAQRTQIHAYRNHFKGERKPRILAGRVIVPIDSADAGTRRKYVEYEKGRHDRTLAPQGERRALISRDLVGTSEQILEALHADSAIGEISELQLELPYEFSHEEYEQILSDVTRSIAPELGWTPTVTPNRPPKSQN
jgi:alkanesulfonate monooxygenase SsuD/methylene tetrahydromethanopterin reductase-like flavin-dependent oxidoreductase (luciferase family)